MYTVVSHSIAFSEGKHDLTFTMSFSGETAQDTEYKSNCNFEGDKCAVLPVMNKSAHLHTETFKQFVYSLMDHPPSLNGFDKQKHCYNQ